jgi:glycosyltransferase involved in cell wall biosynthesis
MKKSVYGGPMIVAHVLSSFFVGGQEVMAVELAARQVARGHRVLAVSLSPTAAGPLDTAFVRAGVETVHLSKRGPTVDITLPLRLALALRRARVDVVHLHNPLPLIYGVPAGKAARCAIVFTRHGLVEGAGRQLWLRRQLARFVDAYVAVSSEVADNSRAHRMATEPKLMVIENGIDLALYRPRSDVRAAVRAELGLSASALAMGTVCRLVEGKNVGLLLRAALPHLGPQVHLLIIGDGPDRAALEAMARAHPQGESVHFLGQRTDVARLLNGLDLFALSSRSEGHPLSVIEAMATGLPVLSTRVGGIPEMIEDAKTGFLSPADEPAFTARLTAALQERPRWTAMGEAARTAACQRFSSERMTDRYLALYQEIRQKQRTA